MRFSTISRTNRPAPSSGNSTDESYLPVIHLRLNQRADLRAGKLLHLIQPEVQRRGNAARGHRRPVFQQSVPGSPLRRTRPVLQRPKSEWWRAASAAGRPRPAGAIPCRPTRCRAPRPPNGSTPHTLIILQLPCRPPAGHNHEVVAAERLSHLFHLNHGGKMVSTTIFPISWI